MLGYVIRRLLFAIPIALGVSVVAAGVALYLLLTRGEPPPAKTAAWTFTLDAGGRSPY